MTEEKNEKPLTLDDLADYGQNVLLPAINRRFDGHGRRFDEHERRFDNIMQRFDRVDQQFEEVKEEIREKFDRVLEGEDKLMKRIEDNEIEQRVHIQSNMTANGTSWMTRRGE